MIETKTSKEVHRMICDCESPQSCEHFDNVRWVKVEDINEWLIEEGNIPQSDGKILIKLHEELKK